MKSLITCFLIVLYPVITLPVKAQTTVQPGAAAVIEQIISHVGAGKFPNTVDVIKRGDPATPVTGIVTCMFATMDVLKKAVAKNCNLIITHEPLFYNHLDETSQFEKDPVYLAKDKYIRDHKLVIWRFHDYVHSIRPDGIDVGMTRKFGWEKYLEPGKSDTYILPETTVSGVAQHLKSIFPGYVFNIIGEPSMKVSKVAFSAGAPGSQAHFRLLRDESIDLIVAGEVQQWETYEYVRDAVSQGRKKAIVFLGHIPSEEAGMKYAAEWMREFITGIPVNFIECSSSYWNF
jgi:putative NIF3 family GTP cyclohydrolase 1 type 2